MHLYLSISYSKCVNHFFIGKYYNSLCCFSFVLLLNMLYVNDTNFCYNLCMSGTYKLLNPSLRNGLFLTLFLCVWINKVMFHPTLNSYCISKRNVKKV